MAPGKPKWYPEKMVPFKSKVMITWKTKVVPGKTKVVPGKTKVVPLKGKAVL